MNEELDRKKLLSRLGYISENYPDCQGCCRLFIKEIQRGNFDIKPKEVEKEK